MRITVDTNVLISATFWKGDSEKIISAAENREIILILSKDIIDEYSMVLNYPEIRDKIKAKRLISNRAIEKIISISKFVQPKRKVDVVKSDPDDNKIIECALAGDVDFIVSQDKHLLDLGYNYIKIVSPSEFLKIMGKKK